MLTNNTEDLVQSDTNLILNNSIESTESSSSVLLDDLSSNPSKLDNFKTKTIKMKTSRTESEISSKQRYIYTIPRSRHTHKPHHQFNALNNDASHYYSLTDVKYYNIDDIEDDQNIISTTSSISTSSLSSSASFTSSSSQATSFSEKDQSFESDNFTQLHKSNTLPSFETNAETPVEPVVTVEAEASAKSPVIKQIATAADSNSKLVLFSKSFK